MLYPRDPPRVRTVLLVLMPAQLADRPAPTVYQGGLLYPDLLVALAAHVERIAMRPLGISVPIVLRVDMPAQPVGQNVPLVSQVDICLPQNGVLPLQVIVGPVVMVTTLTVALRAVLGYSVHVGTIAATVTCTNVPLVK